MAYAAVLSLIRVLEDTQHSPSAQHRILYEKQQIESLLETLTKINDDFPVHPRSDDVRLLEERIRDAAYRAADLIENRVWEHFNSDGWFTAASNKRKFKEQLRVAAREIDSIKEEVMRLQESDDPQLRTHSSDASNHPTPFEMVGFDDELVTLRNRLTNHYESALGIIPMVGMVGSGKTTLARHLYDDPDYIICHFDVRAWVTVSSDYRPKKVLLDLLGCIKVLTPEMYQENYDLLDDLHKCLDSVAGRYLIVMDDVWDTKVWDGIRRTFPDKRMGSRILLTTRDSRVAHHANSEISQHHRMRLLNDAESWDLMRRIVFRNQSYFLNLEEVGKSIARSCKGLPLSIAVISGLLSNVSPRKETWESVAENVNSTLADDEQCSKLLSLSYDRLPHHLKACFLYMEFFPEDFEISVSKLVNLWIAEGFLKPSESKSLEEVGEQYLTELISRQLVLPPKRSISGKIKTCSIHDLMREFCLRKAKEENFFHSTHGSSESIKDPRRISCPSKFSGKDVDKAIFSFVRSLISVSSRQVPGANVAIHHCKLLRVLDLDRVRLKQFPNEIKELVCLVYVCLLCEEKEIHIPKAICRYIQNLQILIILQSSNNNTTNKGSPGVHLPEQLWSMPKLRYLKFRKCYLPAGPFWNRSINLENLHTLSKLSSSSCNLNFFKRTPNLKKLGGNVEKSAGYFYDHFCLSNVGNLPKLEKLEVIAEIGSKVSIPRNFTLPARLKKLTLNRTKLPWKDMSIVGSLTELEELELINNAFQGSEWEPMFEDGFGLLKSLTPDELDLEYWRADATHFPKLVHLRIWECGNLKEISPEIGMIQTLETIEVDDASPHAVTWAKNIQQYHQDMGNESFEACFFYIWSNEYQKRTEAKEAFMRRKEEEEKKRKKEEERRKMNERFGPPPIPDHHRQSTDDWHRRSTDDWHDHGFGRTRFPGEGIHGEPGFHRSFDPFDTPGNIRGEPPYSSRAD